MVGDQIKAAKEGVKLFAASLPSVKPTNDNIEKTKTSPRRPDTFFEKIVHFFWMIFVVGICLFFGFVILSFFIS